jgi:hypothetical protein
MSFSAVLALAAMLWPAAAPAQDLVNEAMSSFPAGTLRIEYSGLAKLRALPDYAALSHRYTGARLQQLEDSLAQLGVQQDDVDELVLGWQSQSTGIDFSGLARGRFSAQTVADRATAQGIAASPLTGASAYCLGEAAGGNCIAILSDNLGAFGSLAALGTILKVRAGDLPAASSDTAFARHVDDARNDAPIWGVATGPAIPDWFKGWIPNQGNVQLDLTKTLQSADDLTYIIQPTDKVRLDVKMDCKSSQGAANLRQVMQGLKLVQQMAWQSQNPNMPNPFQSLQVEGSDREVRMNLTTAYAQLEAGNMPGKS